MEIIAGLVIETFGLESWTKVNNMKRGALIKLVSFSTGVALSAPLLSSLITSYQEAVKIEEADYATFF